MGKVFIDSSDWSHGEDSLSMDLGLIHRSEHIVMKVRSLLNVE